MVTRETYELISDLMEDLKAAQLDTFVDDTQLKIERAEKWLRDHKELYEMLGKPLLPVNKVKIGELFK